MIARLVGTVLLGADLIAGAAQAGSITHYYGDEDCFGTRHATCPDATIPPEFEANLNALYGVFTRELLEPLGQDSYNTSALPAGFSMSWRHTITLTGLDVTGAEIRMRTGGLADLRGPYSILINNTVVGEIPMVTGGFEELYKVKLFTFAFDPALLLEGLNTVSLSRPLDGRGLDTFSWDFSSLTLFTRDTPSPIAEPAPLALALGGFALLAMLRRRRASAA